MHKRFKKPEESLENKEKLLPCFKFYMRKAAIFRNIIKCGFDNIYSIIKSCFALTSASVKKW